MENKLFIIDWKKKGNVVRFYLGDDPEYWGDDWNDRPYEHNAEEVYDEFIKGYKDVIFPFEYSVFEPCEGSWNYNSPYSKEDMKNGVVPCIVAVILPEYSYFDNFSTVVGNKNAKKFYFGDEMVPDVIFDTKGE